MGSHSPLDDIHLYNVTSLSPGFVLLPSILALYTQPLLPFSTVGVIVTSGVVLSISVILPS